MMCADVERLVHPYIDGELDGEDCTAVERHAAGCETCRAKVAYHARFKADLRSRLRSSAARPEPPERLLEQVRAALDRADARGEGPVPRVWRRALPASAGMLAAAAMLFFVLRPASHADSEIVDEAIRGHEKNLPIEIGGPSINDDQIKSWMLGKVPVPVRPPISVARPAKRLSMTVSLVGARVYHLQNRDVGQIMYHVGPNLMTVFVFDPSGWELSAPQRRVVGQHEVYLAEERGYSVAMYRYRGVGYAFTSDLGPDELLEVLAAALGE
jgi:anti-sigma factor RsiW